jgi:hypothetical protein
MKKCIRWSHLTPYFVEQHPSSGVTEGIPKASEASFSNMVVPQMLFAAVCLLIMVCCALHRVEISHSIALIVNKEVNKPTLSLILAF